MLRPLLALLAAVAVVGMMGLSSVFSGATLSSTSNNTARVSAAADWTPPTVAVQDPGTQIRGIASIVATATDAESGVAGVTLSYLDQSSTWRALCTVAAAPYTCAWDTTQVADGTYQLRASATDQAGYTSTSAVISTIVANNLSVVLSDPGAVVRGTVSLTNTLLGAGATSYVVTVEYQVAGATNGWKTLPGCAKMAAPYACSFVTTGLADNYYDLRSYVAPGTGSGTPIYSTIVDSVLVDNTPPTVTLADPGATLRGTVSFSASATDNAAGIQSIAFQYQPTGSSTWTAMCTSASAPYSCQYNTAQLPGGTYNLRAVATDGAGNVTSSAVVGPRTVDNSVSSISLADPGSYLVGTVTLVANPQASIGVRSVTIQRAPNGGTVWTDVCAPTASPYQCAWDTTTVADGLYDLRAVLVDSTGTTVVSTVVSARRVANAGVRAYDVQTANGGTTIGKAEAKDSITFTYSDIVKPGSILAGWSGASQAVTLRIRDGGLLTPAQTGTNDTVDVLSGTTPVNLGTVNLKQDIIKGGTSATFNATMVASTTTVNGVTVTTIKVTLGTAVTGTKSLTTSALTSAMVWTPSTAAQDQLGRACLAAPATELGVADKDF